MEMGLLEGVEPRLDEKDMLEKDMLFGWCCCVFG